MLPEDDAANFTNHVVKNKLSKQSVIIYLYIFVYTEIHPTMTR